MTAMLRQAGAAPHDLVPWQAIDWQQAHQNVRRLQARIVKATQGGRRGKVKALATAADPRVQRQSPCRQTSDGKPRQTDPRRGPGNLGNPGSRRPQAIRTLRHHGYRPSATATRVHPKKQRQPTPSGYPDHARPCHAGTSPAGAQPGRGDHRRPELLRISGRAVHGRRHRALLHRTAAKTVAPWVLEGDIQGCFDNISHDWMLAHVPTGQSHPAKVAEGRVSLENHVLFT